MRRLLTLIKGFFIFIVLVLAVLLAVNALSYANFDVQYGFLRLKQQAIQTGWYLPAYYSHVLISGVILVAGLFLVFPASRNFPQVHRMLGYVYVMGILFFSAPGALGMSLFIQRGPWVLASFLLQGVLWFYFTAVAFSRIRRKDVTGHRQWMWRSYALTFAAVTLRLYIYMTSSSVDLSSPKAYALLAWLSWVPNLLVAELLINLPFREPSRQVN
ncbi:DUF2306 domain-containing protein [Fulvivirgaceae bacterium PWU5]|uniref:DUF2306 domain-containing protein n=1 Tax=Dawidia cretensis TaxID=2782350 RepID=A0AAP2GRZ8_9BACT|nr:DUF2306 domain-containing protein [Dawidia cretensis]MBT1711191.1 DUF2306 domain-containing protein [Dawidia cretensis]